MPSLLIVVCSFICLCMFLTEDRCQDSGLSVETILQIDPHQILKQLKTIDLCRAEYNSRGDNAARNILIIFKSNK